MEGAWRRDFAGVAVAVGKIRGREELNRDRRRRDRKRDKDRTRKKTLQRRPFGD